QADDWARVTRQEVIKRGGGLLFSVYPSLGHVLKALYPNHPWGDSARIESTERTPYGFWQYQENLLKALDTAQEKLGITQVSTSIIAFDLIELIEIHL